MRIMLTFCIAGFLLCGTLTADEVFFKNGDHLTGTIKNVLDGKMNLEAEKVGPVTVNLKDIATFSSADPMEVLFKDGTLIKEKARASTDGKIILEVSPSREPLTFLIADIVKINPAKAKWTGSVAAGMAFTRGNTYQNTANASVEAIRRSEIDRITFKAGYIGNRQKSDNGEMETTQRESYLGLQFDYFFSKKFYGYGNAKMERDALADLDIRFVSGVGAGYQWAEADEFSFNTETGISWISENYAGMTDSERYFAARAAYNLSGQFNKYVTYFHNAEWLPSIEDFDEDHVVTAEAGLRSSLTASLFAELKAVWQWDSSPAQNKKHTDVTYLASIGWSF